MSTDRDLHLSLGAEVADARPKLVLEGHSDARSPRVSFRRLGCGSAWVALYATMIFGNRWTAILARLQETGQTVAGGRAEIRGGLAADPEVSRMW